MPVQTVARPLLRRAICFVIYANMWLKVVVQVQRSPNHSHLHRDITRTLLWQDME
jgi:hypothetical protein